MFYEKLEKLLDENNLTLNKLAKAINIAQSPTSRWKNGTLPSLETFKKICEYFKVSSDYLLDLSPPDTTPEERKLLDYFRESDERSREMILDLAAREADRNKAKETSLNLEKIG